MILIFFEYFPATAINVFVPAKIKLFITFLTDSIFINIKVVVIKVLGLYSVNQNDQSKHKEYFNTLSISLRENNRHPKQVERKKLRLIECFAGEKMFSFDNIFAITALHLFFFY